ncbi:MAG: hypothetical protein LC624_11185 [Halobacteriales archaeon]|nr:hypothetical protein [Halobacteriales archaeon]
MPARRVALVFGMTALLAAAVLASVGPASPPLAGIAPHTADAAPLLLDDCRYVEINARIPAAIVAPYVPADFRINGDPVATMAFGGADCRAAQGGATGRVAFAWNDIPVTPLRPDLQVPGIGVVMWRIEHLTLPDLYEQANDAVHATHASMDRIAVTADPTLTGGDMDAQAPGFDRHLRAPGPGLRSTAFNVWYREYGWATDGGYAYLDGNVTSGEDAQSIAGVFTPDPGSIAFQVAGPAAAGLTSVGNGFSFPGLKFGHIAP